MQIGRLFRTKSKEPNFGETAMPTNEKRNQTDFQREQAVFLAAVEAAGPADRKAVLDRQCADDASLRQRVEALLAAHDAEGSLPPAGAAVAETRAWRPWLAR